MNLLDTLPYHQKVMEHFKRQKKTWDFFSARQQKQDQLQAFKNDLLKNTYKFTTEAEPDLYEKMNDAKKELDMAQLPVTLYQAQFTDELNASVIFQENEAHVIISGPLIKLLTGNELKAVFAHELSHIKLYSMLDGNLETADRIITSIANSVHADAVNYETAKRFRLYTEIFCDRGSYVVMKDIDPVITSLVKVSTGLEKVNSDSYLKQAEEIFASNKDLQTKGISHPENFIRARAIYLWKEKGKEADIEIEKMIEGIIDIDQLDLFGQKIIAQLTQDIICLFLKPRWIQSPMVMALAKQYFENFSFKENVVLTNELIAQLSEAHNSVKDYLTYVLVDFALVDQSLEEIPMGWAFKFAEEIGIKNNFDKTIKAEKKLSEKRLQQLRQAALEAYQSIKETDSEQIYE